ncbi:hypothetical protein B0J17DRAFT_645662 [Rhizoctonia solani]|nr:hypothetical protein B0J17DRAFT_645662 [Rhizoctonia solani]
MEAWDHISVNYRPGDRVCLFGYSRGAFAARKVASLLNRLELSHSGRRFLEKWMQYEKPLPWLSAPVTSQPVPVECIGVWDTVGAVYNSIFRLKQNLIGIPDTELPPNVRYALQALAFHENRMRFRAILFEGAVDNHVVLKQVWFPGSHSDVGGGGSTYHLPSISLLWLLGELDPCIQIHNHRIHYPDTKLLSPSNAFNESRWQFIDRYETRLGSNVLQTNAMVHITVEEVDETDSWPRSADYPLLDIRELGFLRLRIISLNRRETAARTVSR